VPNVQPSSKLNTGIDPRINGNGARGDGTGQKYGDSRWPSRDSDEHSASPCLWIPNDEIARYRQPIRSPAVFANRLSVLYTRIARLEMLQYPAACGQSAAGGHGFCPPPIGVVLKFSASRANAKDPRWPRGPAGSGPVRFRVGSCSAIVPGARQLSWTITEKTLRPSLRPSPARGTTGLLQVLEPAKKMVRRVAGNPMKTLAKIAYVTRRGCGKCRRRSTSPKRRVPPDTRHVPDTVLKGGPCCLPTHRYAAWRI